jgi:WD40 repeat protein
MVWEVVMKHTPRSVEYSYDGNMLAVGCKDGYICFIEAETGKVTLEKNCCKEEINAIVFHPDGKQVAAGSNDQNVVILSQENGKLTKMEGHTSSVTHINFSTDGCFLMTNSRDYEILYWDATAGKRLNNKPNKAKWLNWNCVLGWCAQGIFQGKDGTDVNALHISGSDDQHDDGGGKKVLVTGDDNGNVSMFRFPSISPNAPSKVYIGHSAHVTNVRFSPGDKYLLTSGGGDLSVMQWAFNPEPKEEVSAEEKANAGGW